ncbi:MAG: exosortase [Desulfuromonadales bacterium]|nr:MAG: exosortase [Desulfuromonadales bacterium]
MIEWRRQIISISVFLAAFGLLYASAIQGMVLDWYHDENYSHGFLIPLISGYLVWQRLDELKEVEYRPNALGFAVALLGIALFLFGMLAGESFTMRFSMLAVLGGAILYGYGVGLMKAVAFPFAYLLYMIPLPYILYDSIAFPLKLMVSKYSVAFLKMIGIPVMRDGNVINLVSTTLEVADACSGIRSIVSLLALATALAYFSHQGWMKRTILIFSALPIAIFANGVRVIGTGILANRYGAAAAQGFFHEFAGLVIFGVAMALLLVTSFILGKIGGRGHE